MTKKRLLEKPYVKSVIDIFVPIFSPLASCFVMCNLPRDLTKSANTTEENVKLMHVNVRPNVDH